MLSKSVEQSVTQSHDYARANRFKVVTTEQLLLSLLDNAEVVDVLKNVDCDIHQLRADLVKHIHRNTPKLPDGAEPEEKVSISIGFQRVLQRAIFQVSSNNQGEAGGGNVLIAIYHEEESFAVWLLQEQGIERVDVLNYISHGISKREESDDDLYASLEDARELDTGETEEGRTSKRRGKKKEDPLELFARNLNEAAKAGQIDPLIGREHELQRIMQILCRRRKNNPLLVGESGVGKTAIVEGLAKKIVDNEVPNAITENVIYALDMGSILAGTRYRGDFEERFKAVMKRMLEVPGATLFIDEIHTVVGAGSASGSVMDASNLLKPVLTTGELRCIGSTTYKEYRGIFEQDHALSRRFLKVDVPEPTVPDTVKILTGLKSRYEDHHGIQYDESAITAAAELSDKYITGRFLPDKAIDVVDEAGAATKLWSPEEKTQSALDESHIEDVVAKIARIPSAKVSAKDKSALEELEADLNLVVFGQEEAIKSLASSIRLARAGLKEEGKPIGSYLFAGPTGVGKTEVCRQLAKTMGVELIRFDMSEYMERHTVSRLIGAPPGYVGYDQGGLLTEAITKHPHSVLLLDEVEKAHPDVFNILLQVMDHGTLTDNNGRKADFRNVVVIMTTNAGAQEASRASIGFSVQDHSSDALEKLNQMFSPEFRNRLDSIIQFNPLSMEVIKSVVGKFIDELQGQLDAKNVEIYFDEDARLWLAENGYDEAMGARPMQRLIQERVKRELAGSILFGDLANEGGIARVTVKDGELVVTTEPRQNSKKLEQIEEE